MKRKADKVEIKEPPLQELNKKRSCLKRGCLAGCGCVFVFLIGSLLLLKFTAEPRIREIDHLPPSVKTALPIYDEAGIELISFISGKERDKSIERIAFIPKIIVTPIVLLMREARNIHTSTEHVLFDRDEWLRLIERPVTDERDLYKIEWKALSAKPSFISDYYRTALAKKKFMLTTTNDSESVRQFEFNRGDVNGMVHITDDPKRDGTDYVLVTINVPSEK